MTIYHVTETLELLSTYNVYFVIIQKKFFFVMNLFGFYAQSLYCICIEKKI